MAINWTTERVAAWERDERTERDARVARRWRLRAISDRSEHQVGGAPVADFVAIVDSDLEIWLRPFSADDPFERRASGPGVDVEIVEDITLGLPHDVRVQVKPSDDTVASWACSCGVGSRGTTSPELAREAADAHVAGARDRGPRRRDSAVGQWGDGVWSEREINVARRFRVCARSDFSAVKVHQMGYGEEFELVLDTQLGLWLRRLGHDAALRRDEGAAGVSLLVMELM